MLDMIFEIFYCSFVPVSYSLEHDRGLSLSNLRTFCVHNTQVPFIFINRALGSPPSPFCCYDAELFVSEWLRMEDMRGSINGIDFPPSYSGHVVVPY
jgi:hypothetical protein